MDLRSIDLNLLLALEAIASTRSVTRAAQALGVGQPAMSASLARLRELFDDEVFIRAGGEMVPTPKARQLLGGIGSALAQLRVTLGEEVAFDPAEARQRFTIATSDYVAAVLVPGLVRTLAREGPGLDLQVVGLDKSDVAELLDGGLADVVIGVLPQPPDRVVRTPLFTERFVGVARAGHPALREGAVGLDAFAAAAHALVSLRRDARGAVDEALDKLGLSRRIGLTLPHMLALPGVLAESDLLAAVPLRLAARFGREGLVTFELPVEVPAWEVSMLWSPTARRDRASAWFRERVLELARA